MTKNNEGIVRGSQDELTPHHQYGHTYINRFVSSSEKKDYSKEV